MDTLTFLFTDIEGSTALWTGWGTTVTRGCWPVITLVRSALAAHGGREIDTPGDAFFAVFSSPRTCVTAVLAMQQALEAHGSPGGEWCGPWQAG